MLGFNRKEEEATMETGNPRCLKLLSVSCILSVAIVGCSSKLEQVDPGTPRGSHLPEPALESPPTAWSDSDEYRSSNGLPLIKAAEGYAARQTGEPGGRGKTVAVLDTEIDFDHDELSSRGNFRFSDDIEGNGQHGTHVAGTVAALRDGNGVHGVAYNADLIGIAVLREVDVIRVGPLLNPVLENATDVAAGIASAAGVKERYFPRDAAGVPSPEFKESNPAGEADIINMSLGGAGSDPHEQIKHAMKIAARENKIMVVALGNEAVFQPSGPPAEYVADSGIAGHAIAVGALDSPGNGRARFSNACRTVEEYCLFAPGENIRSTLPNNEYGELSGTSMATPHVAGAAAVVWAAFPNKNSRQIVRRLLDTADPMAHRLDAPNGRDPINGDDLSIVFGHGMLNLQAALNPVGFVSVPSTAGDLVPVRSSTVTLPPGFQAPSSTALSNTITYDEQGFPFRYDMTSVFRETSAKAPDSPLEDFLASLGRSVFLPVGTKTSIELMSHTVTSSLHGYASNESAVMGTRPEDVPEEGYRVHFSPLPELAVVIGQGAEAVGMSNDIILNRTRRAIFQDSRSVAPFAAFVGEGMSMSLAWRLNESTTIDLAGKDGDSYFGSGSTQLVSLGLTRRINDRFVTGTRLGHLEEDDSLLGIRGEGVFDGLSEAATSFLDVGVSANLSDDLVLFGSLSQGLTNDKPNRRIGGFVSSWSDIHSGSYVMGGEFRDLWGKDRVTLTASQPFRPRKVRLRVEVPNREVADGVVGYVEETVDLAPDGRETRIQLMYEKDGGGRHRVSFAAGGYVRMEPNHDASTETEYGVGVKAGMRF